MKVFKHPITVNLWLGSSSCTLFADTLSELREQLLVILDKFTSCTNDNKSYEVNVTCKLSGVTTTYNGDNKNEVVTLIEQMLK